VTDKIAAEGFRTIVAQSGRTSLIPGNPVAAVYEKAYDTPFSTRDQ